MYRSASSSVGVTRTAHTQPAARSDPALLAPVNASLTFSLASFIACLSFLLIHPTCKCVCDFYISSFQTFIITRVLISKISSCPWHYISHAFCMLLSVKEFLYRQLLNCDVVYVNVTACCHILMLGANFNLDISYFAF